MTSILLKVDEIIKKELQQIREAEGLGSQTATVVYLVKYYNLTKQSRLDGKIALLDSLLDKIEVKDLPSLKDQLKDL